MTARPLPAVDGGAHGVPLLEVPAVAELSAPDSYMARNSRSFHFATAFMRRAERERTARVYADAILGTMALLADPTRRALARWGSALVDLGVTDDALSEGYGTSYAAALEEFRV